MNNLVVPMVLATFLFVACDNQNQNHQNLLHDYTTIEEQCLSENFNLQLEVSGKFANLQSAALSGEGNKIAITIAERRANERVCGHLSECFDFRGDQIKGMMFHACLVDSTLR